MDEVFVKINGERRYLWRAVDYEWEALESFVTKRRGRKAELKFLRKIIKLHSRKYTFVTDKLRSWGAVMKDFSKKLGAGLKIELRIHMSH
ncbi:MAG: putative transposase [Octadecabacter sp.]